MNTPLISVIIPIYNVEKYLRKCIDSVLNQNQSDLCEIILVDDGSTDGCSLICDEYKSKPGVTVIHQKNGGLSNARNAGLKIATGQYVFFVDSDDRINDGSIVYLSNIISKYSPDIISGKILFSDSCGINYKSACYNIEPGMYDINNFLLKTKNEVFIAYVPSYLFKRSVITENELFFLPNLLNEDELWTHQFLMHAKNIYCDNFSFYTRYARSGSIMDTLTADERAQNYFKICKVLVKEQSYDGEKNLLNNHLVGLFFYALVKADSPYSYIKEFDRSFPIKYSGTLSMKIKSVIYLISPHLLILLIQIKNHKFLKKNSVSE